MADDYYELLEVGAGATGEEIRAAITRQRRIWVRRQSSPDPARRVLAEQRVRDVDAAEKTLLDPGARRVYDEQRGRTQRQEPVGGPPTAGRNASQPAPAGEDLSEHLERGEDYLDQGRWRLAQVEFEYVRERSPADLRAQAGLGAVHVGAGRVKEGLATLERLAAEHPDDDDLKLTLATALYDSAMAGVSDVGDVHRRTRPMILSRRQLTVVRRRLRRIRRLGLSDWQVRMYVEDLKDLITHARKPVWTRSGNLRFYALLLAAAAFVAFVPSIESLRLLGAVWLVMIIGVYVVRHRQPGWKYHRQDRWRARRR
ncbi:MAG TPA: tetratricopeptide repeat protein [Actinopolymorphaceae bacterium]|jgi:curved DNA-binding protein CbpA|nr:tetratricopeptide repeat protein [Actinopolymorphaceae bacterium]